MRGASIVRHELVCPLCERTEMVDLVMDDGGALPYRHECNCGRHMITLANWKAMPKHRRERVQKAARKMLSR